MAAEGAQGTNLIGGVILSLHEFRVLGWVRTAMGMANLTSLEPMGYSAALFWEVMTSAALF